MTKEQYNKVTHASRFREAGKAHDKIIQEAVGKEHFMISVKVINQAVNVMRAHHYALDACLGGIKMPTHLDGTFAAIVSKDEFSKLALPALGLGHLDLDVAEQYLDRGCSTTDYKYDGMRKMKINGTALSEAAPGAAEKKVVESFCKEYKDPATKDMEVVYFKEHCHQLASAHYPVYGDLEFADTETMCQDAMVNFVCDNISTNFFISSNN